LFGNGERTGNVDLVNLALNLYTQGIHPNLDFSDIEGVLSVVTQCNDLPVHPRHPYAGELVFTAFSGSHQDAIKKGFESQKKVHAEAAAKGEPQYWNMPYLPLDPADLGADYDAVIRVNSQSGKGGIAYIVKQHLQLDLPRKMQIAFYKVIQAIADREAREMTVDDITTAFRKTYHFGGSRYQGRLALRNYNLTTEPVDHASYLSDESPNERCRFDGTLSVDGVLRVIRGDGNGPISALHDALLTYLHIDLSVREYSEHAIGEGHNAKAASYVELVPTTDRKSTETFWGVGVDSSIAGSGLRALLSAANNAIRDRPLPELKLTLGYNSKSGQADIANVIVNALGLELPRRLQASFFEVVQRKALDEGGEISVDAVTELFRKTYEYESGGVARFEMKAFAMEHVDGGSRRRLVGDLIIDGHTRNISGEGNGPISALLAAIHSQVQGVLSVREYSEHSVGEGAEVLAASYVQLAYDREGSETTSAWGVATDTDITASGLKALVSATNRLHIVTKGTVNGV
jgi:2-isopropylmalate synthase